MASSARQGVRQGRWQKIAEAATLQCGRATVPTITDLQRFEAVIEQIEGQRGLLPTLAEQGVPLKSAMEDLCQEGDMTVLIGPEGDFSPEEVADAKRRGLQPVSLGSLTLRSETAALVTLAIVQHTVGLL